MASIFDDIRRTYEQLASRTKSRYQKLPEWVKQSPVRTAVDYFSPTSRGGQNFWSTPTAQKLADTQKATQQIIRPVARISQKAEQVAQPVIKPIKQATDILYKRPVQYLAKTFIYDPATRTPFPSSLPASYQRQVASHPVGSPEREQAIANFALSTILSMHGGIKDVSSWRQVGATIPPDTARKVLGVKRGATEKQIAEAYRKFVAKHHPDIGGDPKAFELAKRARDSLLNLVKGTTTPQGPILLGSGGKEVTATSPRPPERVMAPTIPKELEPLAREARKYKSAEEFVDFNTPKVYRGQFAGEKGIPREGLSTTLDFNQANKYAKARGLGGEKITYYINPKAKKISLEDVPNEVRGSGEGSDFAGRAAIWARKQGYDILDMSKGNEAEMRILTENAFTTEDKIKSQLTDFYNQVVKESKPTIKIKPPEKPPEAIITQDVNAKLSSLGYDRNQISRLSNLEKKKIAEDLIPPFLHKSTSPTVKVKGQTEAIEKFVKEEPEQVLSNTKKVNILDYLATPENVLARVGLKKEATALRKAHEGYNKELRQEIGRLAKWMDQAPDNDSAQRIFQYLDGKKVVLRPNEEEVVKEIKPYLKNWADRLGLPADKRITDYITHIFPKGYIEKDFDPEIAKMIDNKVAKSTYNPFLQKRLGKEGYIEDVWRALQAYIKRGVRKANMDPALEKVEEAASKVDLETYKYIQRYISRINMRPTEIDNLIDNLIKSSPIGYRLGQRPTMRLTQGFRQMVYRATLGLNPTSALKNLSQGANTYAKLGEKYTVLGYTDFLKKAVKKDLTELYQEGVLDDGFIQDRTIGVHKSLMQKLDPTLFTLFDIAEKINRGAAYFGAQKKAIAEGKSTEEAINYAKKIVRETQFNYDAIDTPVFFASDIAKLLAQFQTFTVKQGEFLLGMLKNKEWAGLVRYLAATFAFMFSVGKLIGYRLDDIIPSVRFESPFTQFWDTGKKIVSTDEDVRRQGIRELPRLGALMVPAGSQAKKTIEGLQAVEEGASLTPTGRVRFEIEKSFSNTLRAALFGQWNLPGAREYIRNMGVAKSEQTIKELKKMSRAEAVEALTKIKEENPSLYSSIKKQVEDKELGVTKREKEIRNLPVKDGTRTRVIVKELNKKKTSREKEALLRDWIKKGVITETVADQLAAMRRTGKLRL